MSKVCWLGWVALLMGLPGLGQTARPRGTAAHAAVSTASAVVPAETQTLLTSMVARAGVIFAGHVLEVAPGNGFVDVKFRIDEPVRGCNKLGLYVLREWAGLWDGQPDRYRVGERLMLLLTARSSAGMSAPVGGDEGILPIAASGVEPLADGNGNAPPEDGSVAANINGMTVDLRWVQARAPRTAGPPEPGTNENSAPVTAGDEPVERWGPVAPVVVSFGAPAGPPTVAAVLAVLRAAAGYAPVARSAHEGR